MQKPIDTKLAYFLIGSGFALTGLVLLIIIQFTAPLLISFYAIASKYQEIAVSILILASVAIVWRWLFEE